MADFTRDQIADIVNETTVDNNLKLADGADPPIVELAQEGDEFGSAWDAANWAVQDDYRNQAFAGNTWTEVGGIIKPDLKVGAWRSAQKRLYTYGDADIFNHFSDTYAASVGKLSQNELLLWRDVNNDVSFSYRPRITGAQDLIVGKWINRVWTTLKQTYIGFSSQIWLRIKRLLISGPFPNYFYFYYATGDPVANPANWGAPYWWGQITGATFDNTHLLHPLLGNYQEPADSGFQPERSYHRQKTDDGVVAQRFWNDSPECDIINSAAGVVEYAYDASAGRIWDLTGASCTKTEPGTSTVKFKVGYSDDGLDASATFDVAWQTIAQVVANAAAGNYDGHRYLHVKAQFNSDGTDQPSLTDFTISGATVLPPLPPSAAEYNLDEMTNDLDAVPLT